MSDELEPVLGKEDTGANNVGKSKFEVNEDIEDDDESDEEPPIAHNQLNQIHNNLSQENTVDTEMTN